MKQPFLNTITAVVLFATAVPLIVLILAKNVPRLDTGEAQPPPTAANKVVSARKKAAEPDDTKEIFVKLTAKMNGRGVFLFEGDAIRYRHESEADLPQDVTVNGKKWDDLAQPFQLGYTPEFSKAVIRSKQGPNTTKMTATSDKIKLVIDDSVYTWPEYDFVIATKKQVDRTSKSTKTTSATRRDPVPFPTNDFVTPPVVGDFPMGGFPFGPIPPRNGLPERQPPAETVTITLAGAIRGGGFLFENDAIRFVNRWGCPTGLTVNGTPWADPKEPFKLDFTPDYAGAALLEKDGPGDIRLNTGENRFSVSIKPRPPEADSTTPAEDEKDAEDVPPETPFRVKLAVEKPAPRNVATDEITLTIKGQIYGGKFLFRGNTIVFDTNPRRELFWPKDITVDGRPWKDLSQPFELDFTPDYAKTVILEREICELRRFRLYSAFPERECVLFVEDARNDFLDPKLRNSAPQLYPFHVKLAVKNQLPHLEVLWKYAWPSEARKDGSQSAPPRKDPAPKVEKPGGNLRFPPPAGSYTFPEKLPEDIWEKNRKERKIVLTGIFRGSGTFIFEGSTIRYRHEGRDYPTNIMINEAIWGDHLRGGVPTQPVELPFKSPTENFDLKQTEGDRPVKITKISDDCFEVYFKDPEAPPGSRDSRYSITITPSDR